MSRLATLTALADAHRLDIVDLLALGDRSPGELSEALQIPSNLMAHHIKVLGDAGVVTRRRSDGDGRRSYVALNLADPVVAGAVRAGSPLAAPRVVFVCTQNSARSQLAASLFASLSDVPVASAGTEPADAIHPLAACEIATRGLITIGAAPAHVDDVVSPGDLVVCVCDTAYESLADTSVTDIHWSLADPAADATPASFAETFSELAPRVERLAASLT